MHLRLLSLLEQNPAWTQRQIADALGVSLGWTNYCLRAELGEDNPGPGSATPPSVKSPPPSASTPAGQAA